MVEKDHEISTSPLSLWPSDGSFEGAGTGLIRHQLKVFLPWRLGAIVQEPTLRGVGVGNVTPLRAVEVIAGHPLQH